MNWNISNKSLWEKTVAIRPLLVSKREEGCSKEIDSRIDQICSLEFQRVKLRSIVFLRFIIRCHCTRHGFDQYKHSKTCKSCLYYFVIPRRLLVLPIKH